MSVFSHFGHYPFFFPFFCLLDFFPPCLLKRRKKQCCLPYVTNSAKNHIMISECILYLSKKLKSHWIHQKFKTTSHEYIWLVRSLLNQIVLCNQGEGAGADAGAKLKHGGSGLPQRHALFAKFAALNFHMLPPWGISPQR